MTEWLVALAVSVVALVDAPASAALFPCSEQGILDAIALGGGPHTFDCPSGAVVSPSERITFDNDVILGGSGNLTIRDGFTVDPGFSVELRDLRVRDGGPQGIYNAGSLALVDVEVTSFSTGGGAIRNDGTLVLRNSTVSDNNQPALPLSPSAIANRGWLLMINSTVSGNLGVAIWDSGYAELIHSTVAGNEGGVISSGDSFIANTIIANNDWGNCVPGFGLVSLGHNLDSDGSCGLTDPTDLPDTDPLLGPLQDNDGPTLTHAPLPGSPVIDTIPLEDCAYDDGDPNTPKIPVQEDQRGILRPKGTACDIGAVEYAPEPAQALMIPVMFVALLGRVAWDRRGVFSHAAAP